MSTRTWNRGFGTRTWHPSVILMFLKVFCWAELGNCGLGGSKLGEGLAPQIGPRCPNHVSVSVSFRSASVLQWFLNAFRFGLLWGGRHLHLRVSISESRPGVAVSFPCFVSVSPVSFRYPSVMRVKVMVGFVP